MKWLLIISLMFLIFSCQNESKDSKKESNKNAKNADSSQVNQGQMDTQNNNPQEIHFQDFPNDWILLTKLDSLREMKIVSYCDAETPQFYFTLKGDVAFNINYGQSIDHYLVEAFDVSKNSDSIMTGEFTVKDPAETNMFSIKKPVTFVWYKDDHYAEFRGLRENIEVEYFCVNDPQPHFGIVKEPCEEI